MLSLDTPTASAAVKPGIDLSAIDENAVVRSRCQCGSVEMSFPIHSILPLEYGNDYKAAVDCHCRACRKYHVSAFCSYLLAKHDAVDITGPTLKTYRDSCSQLGPVVRMQCGACHSKMATRPLRVEARHGHQLLVNMGAIDDRTLPKPIAKYFQKTRGKWHWDQRAIWTESTGDAEDDDYDDEEETEISQKSQRKITGSCACGQSRYRVSYRGPTELQHCYCRLCRRLSGGVFQTWVPFFIEDFEWVTTGDADDDNTGQIPPMQQYVPHGRRHVCNNCGGVLTIVYHGQEDQIWPAAGGFDDDNLPAGSTEEINQQLHSVMHISCRYRQSWYSIPRDGNPRIPEAG